MKNSVLHNADANSGAFRDAARIAENLMARRKTPASAEEPTAAGAFPRASGVPLPAAGFAQFPRSGARAARSAKPSAASPGAPEY
ncbi:hypothetical protein B5F39_08780 [Cloacibacillus sp. An23]|nr:hypothetical protein B5F39_08780 [Cloacibacillus sp. An23]